MTGLGDPCLMAVPDGRFERIDVFVGGAGGISIRQADLLGERDASLIAMRPQDVDLLVAALMRAKAEALGQ